MLLARGCVKKAFKTARVCQIRHAPLKAFLYSPRIQNHCAKSGKLGFGERTPEACTNLLCVRFVFYWGIEEGIEALAKPIFVRGVSPFYGSAPRTLQWLARPVPLFPFLGKRICVWLRWIVCLMLGLADFFCIFFAAGYDGRKFL